MERYYPPILCSRDTGLTIALIVLTYNLDVNPQAVASSPLKKRAGLAILSALAFAAAYQGAAQNASIAGKWHLVAQTEGGDRIVEPVFQLDGQQVSGKWNGADVKGTFVDGKLDLAFPYNSEEAGQGTLKIKGELKGDKLTGTWEFEGYSGSFRATRGTSAY